MITIEVNDRHVLDLLDRLMRGLSDTTPVMADIAQALASESERQFATESGPLGAWPGLSEESTIPLRTKKGSWPGQKLQVSAGGLAPSVQTAYGKDFASISSNKPYSAMQMFGGTTSASSMIPGKAIPARPYLPFNPETLELSDQAEDNVLDILNAWLDGLAD